MWLKTSMIYFSALVSGELFCSRRMVVMMGKDGMMLVNFPGFFCDWYKSCHSVLKVRLSSSVLVVLVVSASVISVSLVVVWTGTVAGVIMSAKHPGMSYSLTGVQVVLLRNTPQNFVVDLVDGVGNPCAIVVVIEVETAFRFFGGKLLEVFDRLHISPSLNDRGKFLDRVGVVREVDIHVRPINRFSTLIVCEGIGNGGVKENFLVQIDK
jgi:hypothetical protein